MTPELMDTLVDHVGQHGAMSMAGELLVTASCTKSAN
jgi:hypothetical protein